MNQQLEDAVRDSLDRAARHTQIPPDLAERLLDHHTPRPRRPRATVIGALAMTVAACALGVVLSASGGSPAVGRVMTQARLTRLASFDFRLPAGYQARSAGSSCQANPVVFRPSASTPIARSFTEPGISSAANNQGGCIFSVISPPYKPTAADPGPIHVDIMPYGHVLNIDGYRAAITTFNSIEIPPDPSARDELELYVRLPEPGGVYQDIVFASRRISPSQLINVVKAGLSS